jgi:hypothetical protein
VTCYTQCTQGQICDEVAPKCGECWVDPQQGGKAAKGPSQRGKALSSSSRVVGRVIVPAGWTVRSAGHV